MRIHTLLASLSKRRPIFHSEADFQHALAWEVQLSSQTASIRLEQQIAVAGSRVHLDLLVKYGACHVAVELKYKTKNALCTLDEEIFQLRNHGAQDLGRYDFLKDIGRIERYVQSHPGSEGFVVLLTNDPTYWQESGRANSIDAAFRIHQGRIVAEDLAWAAGASKGTMRTRESPICIRGRYDIAWHEYSQIDHQRFRFVAVHVPTVI